MQKYERGENRVSGSRLHQFSQAFGVGEQYFFDDLAPDGSAKRMQRASAVHGKELQRQLTAVLSIEDQRLRGLIIQLLKILTALGGGRIADEPGTSAEP